MSAAPWLQHTCLATVPGPQHSVRASQSRTQKARTHRMHAQTTQGRHEGLTCPLASGQHSTGHDAAIGAPDRLPVVCRSIARGVTCCGRLGYASVHAPKACARQPLSWDTLPNGPGHRCSNTVFTLFIRTLRNIMCALTDPIMSRRGDLCRLHGAHISGPQPSPCPSFRVSIAGATLSLGTLVTR